MRVQTRSTRLDVNVCDVAALHRARKGMGIRTGGTHGVHRGVHTVRQINPARKFWPPLTSQTTSSSSSWSVQQEQHAHTLCFPSILTVPASKGQETHLPSPATQSVASSRLGADQRAVNQARMKSRGIGKFWFGVMLTSGSCVTTFRLLVANFC